MSKNLKSLSKFLAVLLRHQPEQFGIELDAQGFASIDAVWDVIVEKYGARFDKADLIKVVDGDRDGKKRYEIVGQQIRAMYGHSEPEIIYESIEPPELLYHGTNAKAMKVIRQTGLQAQGRQYVHMTINRDTAKIVARRKTHQPVLLVVRAREAAKAGIVFHQPETELYLARTIPPEFIDFPE